VCVCVSECIHMLRSNIYVKFMKYAQNIRYFGQFTRLLLQLLTELCTIVYFFLHFKHIVVILIYVYCN